MSTSLVSSIQSGLAAGGKKSLEAALLELKDYTLETGCFDDELFAELMRVLESDELRDSEYSWLVVRELTEGVDLLTEEQGTVMSGELSELFDSAKNALTAFVAVEALGDMASASSLGLLLALRGRGDDERRALIPMGLFSIATDAADPAVRERAILSLKEMTRSASPRVREEAEKFLSRRHP